MILTAAVAAVISYLTKPLPAWRLVGTTYWTRHQRHKRQHPDKQQQQLNNAESEKGIFPTAEKSVGCPGGEVIYKGRAELRDVDSGKVVSEKQALANSKTEFNGDYTDDVEQQETVLNEKYNNGDNFDIGANIATHGSEHQPEHRSFFQFLRTLPHRCLCFCCLGNQNNHAFKEADAGKMSSLETEDRIHCERFSSLKQGTLATVLLNVNAFVVICVTIGLYVYFR